MDQFATVLGDRRGIDRGPTAGRVFRADQAAIAYRALREDDGRLSDDLRRQLLPLCRSGGYARLSAQELTALAFALRWAAAHAIRYGWTSWQREEALAIAGHLDTLCARLDMLCATLRQ